MIFHKVLLAVSGAALLAWGTGCSQSDDAAQAKPGQPDAQTLINGMKLKQLTKALTLTDEQQKSLRALLDAEKAQIDKIDQDTTIGFIDRTDRVTAIKKDTNEKIKPLLTPDQLATFEAMNAKSAKKKKTP